MTFQQQFGTVNVTVIDHLPGAEQNNLHDPDNERREQYKSREGSLDDNCLELRSKHVIVTIKPDHPYCAPGQQHFVLSSTNAELGDKYAEVSAQFLSLATGDEVIEDIAVRHNPHVHCDIITLTLWSTKLMLRYDLPLVLEHKVTTA